MERIELYDDRGVASTPIVAIKLGMALLLGGAAVIGLGRGVGFDKLWPSGLGVLDLLGFGLSDL